MKAAENTVKDKGGEDIFLRQPENIAVQNRLEFLFAVGRPIENENARGKGEDVQHADKGLDIDNARYLF